MAACYCCCCCRCCYWLLAPGEALAALAMAADAAPDRQAVAPRALAAVALGGHQCQLLRAIQCLCVWNIIAMPIDLVVIRVTIIICRLPPIWWKRVLVVLLDRCCCCCCYSWRWLLLLLLLLLPLLLLLLLLVLLQILKCGIQIPTRILNPPLVRLASEVVFCDETATQPAVPLIIPQLEPFCLFIVVKGRRAWPINDQCSISCSTVCHSLLNGLPLSTMQLHFLSTVFRPQ